MFVSNTYEEIIKLENLIFVDVRSEYEYNLETIPHAINMPILDNDERVEISTIYDMGNHEKAKELAIRYASVKLEDFYVKIRDLSENHNVCLFCQRGSMRSSVIFNILKSMGLSIYRLKGGYKAYRKFVISALEREIKSHEYVNINGFTGVGKTEILDFLEREGHNVLNLEKLANHRGSILGNAGLGNQPSQKMFESLLYEQFTKFDGKLVFVESESSKIGTINVVKDLRQAYNNSAHQVFVNCSIDKRVERIKNDYLQSEKSIPDIKIGIEYLSKYIGKANSDILLDKLEEKDYDDIIRTLIVQYYDKNYAVKKKDFELKVDNVNSNVCADEIIKYYEQ